VANITSSKKSKFYLLFRENNSSRKTCKSPLEVKLGWVLVLFYPSLGNIDSSIVTNRIMNSGKEDALWAINMQFWLNEDLI
jgi:hypothetical protein